MNNLDIDIETEGIITITSDGTGLLTNDNIISSNTCNSNDLVLTPNDLVFAPSPNDMLIYRDGQLTWEPLAPEKKTSIKNFIEHFDICGPGSAKIKKILKKKHSERTEEEKETIRCLMKKDKREKPKIHINSSHEHNLMGLTGGLIYSEDYY